MAKKKPKKKANGKVGGKADVHINEDGRQKQKFTWAKCNFYS